MTIKSGTNMDGIMKNVKVLLWLIFTNFLIGILLGAVSGGIFATFAHVVSPLHCDHIRYENDHFFEMLSFLLIFGLIIGPCSGGISALLWSPLEFLFVKHRQKKGYSIISLKYFRTCVTIVIPAYVCYFWLTVMSIALELCNNYSIIFILSVGVFSFVMAYYFQKHVFDRFEF